MSPLGQRFARGLDRVEWIALRAGGAVKTHASSDLDHRLAPPIKEGNKAGAIRARSLDRPDPPSTSVLVRPGEKRHVTAPVGPCARFGDQTAARSEDRCAVSVAMCVDADDVI